MGKESTGYVSLGVIIGVGLALVLLNYLNLRDGYLRNEYHTNCDPYCHEQSPQNVGGHVSDADFHSNMDECPSDKQDANYYPCRDLYVQKAMAVATVGMEQWNRVAIVVAAVGAALILWTLMETKRSADAAHETNRIARDGNRAWLKSRLINGKITYPIKKGVIGVSFDLTVENVGERPAVNAKLLHVPFYGRHFGAHNYATEEFKNFLAAKVVSESDPVFFPDEPVPMQLELKSVINDDAGIADAPDKCVFLIVMWRYQTAGDSVFAYTSSIYQIDTRPEADPSKVFLQLGQARYIT